MMIDSLTLGHGSTLNTWPSFKKWTEAEFNALGADKGFLPEAYWPDAYVHGKPLLIALCSRAMGSGKSAVADHLVKSHGFMRLKFAGPLKAMTRQLLSELGEDSATIERRVEGDLKEAEIPALKHSCRYLMQRIGTELGRELLHTNVWADITGTRAGQLLRQGKSVVIDDMRYLNELQAVLDAGGVPVRVLRTQATVTVQHSSEGELDGEPMEALDNNWPTLDRLHDYIDTIWLPKLT